MQKPVKIIVKDEVGREVTGNPLENVLLASRCKSYPAPSIPDGEHEAVLQWQGSDLDGIWHNVTNDQDDDPINYRQIYVLAPPTSPNKQLEEAEKEFTTISEAEAKRMREQAICVFELTRGFTGEPVTNAMKSCLKMADYVMILTNKL